MNAGDIVAVKSGFASGYAGAGPRALSDALQLLEAHGAEIEEYLVDAELIERLDDSALLRFDLDTIEDARPKRPVRWRDYILDESGGFPDFASAPWHEFRPVIPYSILDRRIVDLAINFFERPDDRLLVGYRRLEDIVRSRTGIDEHGSKLFSQAFVGTSAKLGWDKINPGEQTGRGNLFPATFQAYRNRRAHRELKENSKDQLTEFLLLNHLFLLERDAVERPPEGTS